jgi:hypothetical protein
MFGRHRANQVSSRLSPIRQTMLTLLGKILFPRSQRWKQRQNVRLLLAALAVGIFFGVIVVGVMLMGNRQSH